jgi:PAS domain S-box-containing protein
MTPSPAASTSSPDRAGHRLEEGQTRNHPLWQRIALAAGLTALVAGLCHVLALPATERYLLLSLVAVICTIYGGAVPGIASTLLGVLLIRGLSTFSQGTQAGSGFEFHVEYVAIQLAAIGLIALLQQKHRKLQDTISLLQQKHKQLEDTFEHSATGMAHSLIDGRWIRVNRTYCDLVGYTHEEVLGMTFRDFTHPDDINIDLELLARTLAGEIDHYSFEKRYIHKRGHIIWVHLTLSLIRKPDGSPDYLIAVVQDISRRKASEEALETSGKLLRQAQNIAGMVTWQMDIATGQVTALWNSNDLLHVPMKLNADDLTRLIHPYDRDQTTAYWIEAVRGEHAYIHEHRILVEGEERWVSVQAEFERDATGRALRALGVTYDITARKRAELEVLRLNSSLEQGIQNRTQALKGAYHELESYSYAVAHDLRSPLRIINGFAMALKEDNPGLDKDSQEHLQRILAASKKMGEFIDGLLTLSQYARGEPTRTNVNLSTIARRQLEEFASHEPQRKVTWMIEDDLWVQADMSLMEALFQNLLGNAWKYSAQVANAHIEVFAKESQNGQRHYCIRDNGAGFDMEQAEKLFEPFQRLHMPSEFAGLGIGLATAMRIVARHGGVIKAHSAPGMGATFSFTLPTDPAAQRPSLDDASRPG